MKKAKPTPGQFLVDRLRDSLKSVHIGPIPEGNRPIIWGITNKGECVDGMTLDAFNQKATEFLQQSGRVYQFGNSVVLESNEGEPRLTSLVIQDRPQPFASSHLAPLFGVGDEGGKRKTESLAPAKLINALLLDQCLLARLREIVYYSRRPCFDLDFNLCVNGWNTGSGILVHATEIMPALPAPTLSTESKVIDRLPPHLRCLLREFCFLDDADLVNAVAMLLTGVLINHFVDEPHPVAIVDANQRGTGKTLLVQVIGRILDGSEPPRLPFALEEELEKQLGASLRESRTSLFFLDNVRSQIESAVLERNALSPILSFRILGHSARIERANTYLWFITSNMTTATPDFISRGMPIRLFIEGDPKSHGFQGKPLEYAINHRFEILAELIGLVLFWNAAGRPLGAQRHRCSHWAATIGGILGANGLAEFFLSNVHQAEAEMDQGLKDLATLAEAIVTGPDSDFWVETCEDGSAKGKLPRDWAPWLIRTGLMDPKNATRSSASLSTSIGIMLSSHVNRDMIVETDNGTYKATLCVREAGSRKKYYYFAVLRLGNGAGKVIPGPGPKPASSLANESMVTPSDAARVALAGQSPPPGGQEVDWFTSSGPP